jgi:hypothetical protein
MTPAHGMEEVTGSNPLGGSCGGSDDNAKAERSIRRNGALLLDLRFTVQ